MPNVVSNYQKDKEQMATIKRQKKRPPSSSKKKTQIRFNPLRVFVRLVFLLIILQIYNSSLIIENVDLDWTSSIPI